MYANDIVLFSKATRRDAATLMKTLDKYCKWSGQAINMGKSRVYFSKHTQGQTRRTVKSILQMKNLKKDAIYLGAPLFLSRSPCKDFTFLIDKLESKLLGWRSKCLSWARRRTLINLVAKTLPNYAMSTFSVPNKVCDRLDSLTRRFWWKPSQREGRFIVWSAWDKLCYPRSHDGLRFKKAKEMNNALLAKLAWMIASKRDSTCMRILRLKYKVSEDWLRAKAPKNASTIWKAIEKAKSIVSKGACYLIGDGKSVDIWLDSWVSWIQGFTPAPKTASTPQVATKVSQLIDPDLRKWKAP